MLKLVVSVLATAVVLILAAPVSAQYPPPEGNLTPEGPTSSTPNALIEVTCTLRDAAGEPVANELIFFELSDPHGDAQLQKTSGVSDANGQVVVSLFTGSASGELEVVCGSGDIEATYVAQVLGITPPQTGDGGLLKNSGSSAAAAVGLLALVTTATLVLKSVRTSS